MTAVALVLAGGTGSRAGLGHNKALAPLDGRTLLARSIAAVRPHVDAVVVVVHPADVARARAEHGDGVDAVVPGGATRHGSEVAGLAAGPARSADVVAVHDAARPLVPAAVVRAALEACVDAAAGVPGLPRSLPLARPVGDGTATLVEREGLVGVQTPQAVRAEVLRAAFAAVAEDPDPAALRDTVEPVLRTAPDAVVRVTPGSPRNIKVTWPDDLARAATLLATGGGDGAALVAGDLAAAALAGAVHVVGALPVADALRRVHEVRIVAAVDRTGLLDLAGVVHAGPGVLDPGLAEQDAGAAVEAAVRAGATLHVTPAGQEAP